jgi:hypothetical protein
MIGRTILGLGTAMIGIASAAAQEALPSYQADPATYKIIFEDQNFRVIAGSWKKGTTDKPHAHPAPFVVYPLGDCVLRVHNPDGTSHENKSKAGLPFAGPVTSSHTAENISESDCQAIFVERK